MLTGSLAQSCLLIAYLFVDVTKIWSTGWPFEACGKNAILLYIGHEIGGRYFPFYYYVNPSSHALLLMRSLIATTVWIAIGNYLDKIKFYLTL